MTARRPALPRVYDDFATDGDTRLDPAALLGVVPLDPPRRGGTAVVPAEIIVPAPAFHYLPDAGADAVAARRSAPLEPLTDGRATPVEWAVAVVAGLVAAAVIGVIVASV